MSSAVLLAVVALVGLFSLAFVDVANVLVARARARSAADGAAVAAAAEQWPYAEGERDPLGAARGVAEANGVRLDRCDCQPHGRAASVVVSLETRVRLLRVAPPRVRASATARADPGRLFEPG